MAYRRSKEDTEVAQAWKRWIATHGETLRSIGISSGAYASSAHWEHFIWSGAVNEHLRPISVPWSIDALSPAQLKLLLEFLRSHADHVPQDAALLGFLETRVIEAK
jgi:hypothetical protein